MSADTYVPRHYAPGAVNSERLYHEAVGLALDLGIQVYHRGGSMKTMEELRQEILKMHKEPPAPTPG